MPVSFEAFTAGAVPALLALPDHPRRCPLVVFVPGYGAVKEVGLGLAYRLAQRGMASVSFDPVGHGERQDDLLDRAHEPALGGIYPPETGLDIYFNFLRVIASCPKDIRTLLDHLSADARVDVTRAGVTGHSQGSYASFLALADIPELQAAVPMMGVPTFTERLQDLLDETAWSNAEWGRALAAVAEQTAERVATVRRFDPGSRLLQPPPRPLLAMNGDFDSDQPKSYTLNWLRVLRPLYAGKEDRLRWNVYPVGHVMTEEMMADAVEWFERWL